MFTDDFAILVDAFDADVVEITGPMHRRPGVGLGQYQQARLEGDFPDLRRQGGKGNRPFLPGFAQDAGTGASDNA